jgi:hypothetical protein
LCSKKINKKPAVAEMADRVRQLPHFTIIYFEQNISFYLVNNDAFGKVPMNTTNLIREKNFISRTVSEQMRVKDDSPCKAVVVRKSASAAAATGGGRGH